MLFESYTKQNTVYGHAGYSLSTNHITQIAKIKNIFSFLYYINIITNDFFFIIISFFKKK